MFRVGGCVRRGYGIALFVVLGACGSDPAGDEGRISILEGGDLPAPLGLTATVEADGVELRWQAVPQAVTYEVARRQGLGMALGFERTSAGADGSVADGGQTVMQSWRGTVRHVRPQEVDSAVIAVTSGTIFVDRPASTGRYAYRVRALDAYGRTSSWSTEIEVAYLIPTQGDGGVGSGGGTTGGGGGAGGTGDPGTAAGPAREVASGWAHTCAVGASWELWCWGRNWYGQVGDGTAGGSVSTPVRVEPSIAWRRVTAGAEHTCGVSTTGELWCWGRNTYGQLGDGSSTDRNAPVRVTGAVTWRQHTVGYAHTCGRASDGRL